MLYLTDCTAAVAENPDGEADPTRMTLGMKEWVWISALYNDGQKIVPKKAGVFTLSFRDDGTFSARTDCNSMGGEYTAKNGTIAFGSVFMTEMYCEGSQDILFARLVGDSTSYHFTGRGELIFDLKYDSGTVVFR
jgi:heat shock protein HslJ